MTPTEVLIEARKLCETKWGQGTGSSCASVPTGCLCVVTAIRYVCDHGRVSSKKEDAALGLIRQVTDTDDAAEGRELFAWNDHPDRTLADVLAAFDRAIEMSKGDDHE
jgi:hypothetical protein